MSDRLFALRLFARVARKGSFSAAGRELNAVYASGKAAKPSARAFVDYLITDLRVTEPRRSR
jgi:hypothetical protein